jgi:hypothetical protein
VDSSKPKPVVRRLRTVVLIASVFTVGSIAGWCARGLPFVVPLWEPARQSPTSQTFEPMRVEELHKIVEEGERMWSLEEDHQTPHRTHGGII